MDNHFAGDNGTGTEVNPKSWTQLKGSYGTQFRREIGSD